MEGHWKFLGGGGVLKAKILEAKYEAKLEFSWGMEVQNKKTFHGEGSMDIFWNCTMESKELNWNSRGVGWCGLRENLFLEGGMGISWN